MRGPYNPSINDECGLLVDRFDLPPYTGMTWNPSYYPTLVTTAGLTPACTLYGLLLPMHRLEPPARFARIVERIAKRARLKLRPMDISHLDEELKIVHEVYNATLERNWGFVPITMDDLLGAADDIKAIADPKVAADRRDAGGKCRGRPHPAQLQRESSPSPNRPRAGCACCISSG